MGLILGKTELKPIATNAKGAFVTINGEMYYQIVGYDAMQPFFISIASDTNLWMYLASNGGLTAGRTNPDMALFPYYTDDKITESAENTGSKTIFHIQKGGKQYLWEPFSNRHQGAYLIERTIAKSVVGNRIVFSEKNCDLELTFRYSWSSADKFGWVRKCVLQNDSTESAEVELLDGLQNVLPSGIDHHTQNTFSTLVDAYKKTELVAEASLALFRMESILVDRAEPSESLKTNTIWSHGLNQTDYLLSSRQLDNFRMGLPINPETESKGVRGAFFTHTHLTFESSEIKTWYLVAEVSQDIVKVNNLIDYIKTTKDIAVQLENDINKGTEALKSIVAQADGIQQTTDKHGMARHFANTLFNTMRGGFYCDNYTIQRTAFAKHIALFNTNVAKKHAAFLNALPESLTYSDLETQIIAQKDEQLHRLFMEYLPLTFGRRHGDPSRPWNLFNIKVNDENGHRLISYQGNWRDIFQNWEALSLSYPAYINGIIAKFLNATTIDGYNPYKVTSEGIDWEVIEPENPWSNIGYWGDHQMIYLLKLLELSHNHYPRALNGMLNEKLFAYANVPYRLKSYAEIVANPKNSIRFDDDAHKQILALIPTYGQDARLVMDKNGNVLLVSFTEKVLVTLLAKLSNFIPEAGIWMNTLRPEWNDANNALVGSGSSMVTLYYIRRFVAFVKELYAESEQTQFATSTEIEEFLNAISTAFETYKNYLSLGFDNESRRQITDTLGKAGEAYRTKVYAGLSGKTQTVSKVDLINFFDLALTYIDQSITVNRRADGMYQAYNLVSFSDKTVVVNHLYEMLEGQVAVLTSLKLEPAEVVDLLDSLRKSALYRADQNSYILYPNKQLATFLKKNNLPNDAAELPVVKRLLEEHNGKIVTIDKAGGVHFNANFNNAAFLTAAMDSLAGEISVDERKTLLDIYEQIFHHHAFTGRSGSFYKYEGLGCIYWHMVSKLLLAIGENIRKAIAEKADKTIIERLKTHYKEVEKGIGAHKSPQEYGSFPFDPYSHTPTMAGVQQPGMTGQVKEDIINRFFELGLIVCDGCLTIQDTMIDKSEFIYAHDASYIRFTYCATPFVYQLDQQKGIDVHLADGSCISINDYTLNAQLSHHLFSRDGQIKQIVVHFNSLS